VINLPILLGLAAATLVSEDLTSIGAGVLARDGVIDLVPAMAACAAGVYVGDLGLWAIGRVFGRRLMQRGWVASRIDGPALERLGGQIDAGLPWAVLGSRFLPGSRLPMYLAVGLCGERPVAFAAWSLLAVVLWTPALVWLTHTFGAAAAAPLVGALNGSLRHVLSVALLFTVWTLAARVPRLW